MMSSLNPESQGLISAAERRLTEAFKRFEEIGLYNQRKVLEVFREERVGSHHFTSSTGYGYQDHGRQTLENVFAGVFGGEKALVRQQIASGTQAINCCLSGILRPGMEVIFATGAPYDTLRTVLGIEGNAPGNLREYGVITKIIPLSMDGRIDLNTLTGSITPRTKMVVAQRSCGYEDRPSSGLKELAKVFASLKELNPDGNGPVLFVDNCYGEFVEPIEPLEVGADLIAGSLIKNPGGGLAPSGGYVVGRGDLIERVAARLYAPGLGGEVGPSLLNLRLFFQGLFDAPHRVIEMLKAAALYAQVFEDLGFKVSPSPDSERTDVIQRIEFASPDRLLAVCRQVQQASPIESYLHPEPSAMPGYTHQVVMAGGTFVSGATSELSADAPLKPPYNLYFQGCLSYLHAKLALINILDGLKKEKLIP